MSRKWRKWRKLMHELGDVIRTGSGMKMAERKRVRGDWQVFAGVWKMERRRKRVEGG